MDLRKAMDIWRNMEEAGGQQGMAPPPGGAGIPAGRLP